MGIYQDMMEESQGMTCVLLQPSTEIQARLNEACARLRDEDVPEMEVLLNIQILVVSSATDGWNVYIDYLEEELSEIVRSITIV